MGKNKLQKFADMASYDHVFQADFEELRDNGFKLRGKWAADFFANDNPIVIELGCGKGEYTVGLARRCPDKNFIGIDIKGARMHTGATQALNEGLKNVAFIRTRIEFINQFFAPNEISEIWVTFPDPQMSKPRKRLVGTLMLQRYRQFLQTSGLVNLKTDSRFLYLYTIALLNANQITPALTTDDLYKTDDNPSQTTTNDDKRQTLALCRQIQTYYEQKWLDAGLAIKLISFTLPQNKELVEPQEEIEHDNYHNAGRQVKFKDQQHKK